MGSNPVVLLSSRRCDETVCPESCFYEDNGIVSGPALERFREIDVYDDALLQVVHGIWPKLGSAG